jgi:amidase
MLRTGTRRAVDVVAEHLARLDELGHLGAVVARDDEAALATAHDLDETLAQRGPVGVLHGVPFTVKDWIDAEGLPCVGEGSDPDRRPARDATAVARLRAAGGVLLAKTNVGLDHHVHGTCHHPLDPGRSPGGSSSGEAALVATAGSPLGLGSDSGGSVRLPAAWCGVVGLKPSYGVVPTTGHFPRVGQLDDGRTVIGVLARSVRDAWLGVRVIAGPDGHDPACPPVSLRNPGSVPWRDLRVATLGDSGTVAEAASRLVRSGATLADGPDPSIIAEAHHITRRYWSRSSLSGTEVDRLLQDWDRYRRHLARAATSFDVLLSPTVAEPAPPRRPMAGDDYIWTLPWSLTGWAALSLPWGATAEGLPLAVQVVAPAWHDHVVTAVAARLEALPPRA